MTNPTQPRLAGTALEVEHDTRLRKMNRIATALKKQGDMDGAIEMLQDIKQYILDEGMRGLTSDLLRLPKYMQQAGRFAEAITEIKWLIDNPARLCFKRAQSWTDHHVPFFHQRHLADTHKAAALICKREKNDQLYKHHSELASHHHAKSRRLNALLRAEEKVRREAFEQEKAKWKNHQASAEDQPLLREAARALLHGDQAKAMQVMTAIAKRRAKPG